MAPRSLDVEIRLEPGGAIFHRRFTRFISDLTDLSPVFADMAAAFYGWEKDAFASEGSSSGGKWAPLSAAYAAHKAQSGGGTILIRSGRMVRSLTSPSGSDVVRNIDPRRMELGSDVPYAGYHQTGTGRMPARPPIRLTAANKDRWSKIMHAYLLDSATGRLSGARP